MAVMWTHSTLAAFQRMVGGASRSPTPNALEGAAAWAFLFLAPRILVSASAVTSSLARRSTQANASPLALVTQAKRAVDQRGFQSTRKPLAQPRSPKLTAISSVISRSSAERSAPKSSYSGFTTLCCHPLHFYFSTKLTFGLLFFDVQRPTLPVIYPFDTAGLIA